MTAAPDAPAGLRERILVMLSNAQNERLLAEALAARYDVVSDLSAGGLDLCIIDGIVLHRDWEEILALRYREEPVLLPVLLATDRRDIGLLTRDLWRVVDDVIVRPIEKAELRARLETLLRARRLSLRLRDLSDLYEHERRIARRLQDAALPNAFPSVPGVRFDAYYRTGSDESLVGGDWYDVMRLADGRVVFSVGDVSGAGLDAAVTMSNVRQTLRGVAQLHPDPAMMLQAADSALSLDEIDRQVTAFVGVFDPITGFLAYASAGHPPALLRDEGGGVLELRTDGLPLGVDPRGSRHAETAGIRPGAMLVVHTDGLTEAERDILDGERRLHAVLAESDLPEADDVALAIQARLLRGAPHDDVAILVMRAEDDGQPGGTLRRWSFASDDAASARAARAAIIGELEAAGFRESALFGVELVYGELIGNVVRYAPGTIEVVLDCSGAAPVLHVLDRGVGFRMTPRLPYDDMSERGRGLFIINEMVDEFHVLRRSGGGSHASAVLRR
ncbi:MAG TPA: SpoIIE family protein phosphatase [Candidatus Elarobacter sp.]|nr:SpoIIE family protein phosphatase [Candidatus Elarobacter sp.]